MMTSTHLQRESGQSRHGLLHRHSHHGTESSPAAAPPHIVLSQRHPRLHSPSPLPPPAAPANRIRHPSMPHASRLTPQTLGYITPGQRPNESTDLRTVTSRLSPQLLCGSPRSAAHECGRRDARKAAPVRERRRERSGAVIVRGRHKTGAMRVDRGWD